MALNTARAPHIVSIRRRLVLGSCKQGDLVRIRQSVFDIFMLLTLLGRLRSIESRHLEG